MTEKQAFSDEELSRYLDGEAPVALSDAIETVLLTDDPDLQARLEAFRAGQQQFERAMQAALAAAPEMPVLTPAAPQIKAAANWPMGLAGVAVGALAVLSLGWFTPPKAEPGWHEVVANYQSLYTAETLEPIAPTQAEYAKQLDLLSANLGFDFGKLPEVPGLTFKRSQQLGFRGKPLAQLTYLTTSGGPAALCIIRTGKGDTPGIKAEVLKGMSAYSWTDNGFGVLLIGPQDDPALADAAKAFRAALKTAAL